MEEVTMLNASLNTVGSTVINNRLFDTGATVLNRASNASGAYPPGTVIASKYTVVSKMEVVTGEADLYVCRFDEKDYVAKLYRRTVAVKEEVVALLKDMNSQYVARIYDTGIWENRVFEILPLYKNGSLQGRKFSFEELKEHIIPSLNEGLHILHEAGIIHKDLKPSNIMLSDNGKDVAIIDFGISSVKDDESTVIVTKTGMTPEYSAPETFRSLYLEESDYYSLGITVYELFCGYTPYTNMNAEKIEQYVSVQRIPFPPDFPDELEDFITSVTYYDITNRKNKANPNRRWTYNEVLDWCEGRSRPVPGEGAAFNSSGMEILPYIFLNRQYNDIMSLVSAAALNWEDGKKQLFRGLLSGFFKSFNPQLAGFCIDAEEEAFASPQKEDAVFFRLLYKIMPQQNAFFWRGRKYEALPKLGSDLLDDLWNENMTDYDYYDSILDNGLLSWYAKLIAPDNKALCETFVQLEKMYGKNRCSNDRMLVCYYLMGYILTGKKLFHIDGKDFRTVSELAGYMRLLLEKSYEDYYSFCQRLILADGKIEPQLEAWLLSLFKEAEIKGFLSGQSQLMQEAER